MTENWQWNLFPRLRYWLRTGRRCRHVAWGPWLTVDLGRHKIRWCADCGHPEFV